MSEMRSLADAIASIRERRRAAGLPVYDGDLASSTPPNCLACGGLRWVRRDVPLGHPEFGLVWRCQACPPAVVAEHRTDLARRSRLSEGQMAKTFDTFQRRAGTELALSAAAAWAAQPDGWLVIHGTPDRRGQRRLGQGKTHLSCAVTNALIDRGEFVSWWYTPDAVSAFQAAIGTNETQVVLERFQHMSVLVLDDLGAARATEFAIQQFLEPLLNYRERFRLPTLITCIGSPAEIRAGLSESIGRRFQDESLCHVVAITAEQFGLKREAVA